MPCIISTHRLNIFSSYRHVNKLGLVLLIKRQKKCYCFMVLSAKKCCRRTTPTCSLTSHTLQSQEKEGRPGVTAYQSKCCIDNNYSGLLVDGSMVYEHQLCFLYLIGGKVSIIMQNSKHSDWLCQRTTYQEVHMCNITLHVQTTYLPH